MSDLAVRTALRTAIVSRLTTNTELGAVLGQSIPAQLITALGGGRDITFTARTAGAAGNDLTVAYEDPGAPGAELTLVRVGPQLVVRLATDAYAAITTLAEDLVSRINATELQLLAALVDPEGSPYALEAMAEAPLEDGLDGSAAIQYRPSRQPIVIPRLTFFDTGDAGDAVVPLQDRRLTFTVHDIDLDRAEQIARILEKLLNKQPLPLPDEEGLVAYMWRVSDNDIVTDDADLVRKQVVFRALVYEWNGAPPFDEGA